MAAASPAVGVGVGIGDGDGVGDAAGRGGGFEVGVGADVEVGEGSEATVGAGRGAVGVAGSVGTGVGPAGAAVASCGAVGVAAGTLGSARSPHATSRAATPANPYVQVHRVMPTDLLELVFNAVEVGVDDDELVLEEAVRRTRLEERPVVAPGYRLGVRDGDGEPALHVEWPLG